MVSVTSIHVPITAQANTPGTPGFAWGFVPWLAVLWLVLMAGVGRWGAARAVLWPALGLLAGPLLMWAMTVHKSDTEFVDAFLDPAGTTQLILESYNSQIGVPSNRAASVHQWGSGCAENAPILAPPLPHSRDTLSPVSYTHLTLPTTPYV